ncbi:MAG: hypothetical protein JXB29_04865 [Sedimentisphaerales bacterium]|nr:hypothetical protein [Sedimentisphaerales bacterium]
MVARLYKTFFILFIITVLLFPKAGSGLVITHEEGRWPESWPEGLESYRQKARTIELAMGNQESVYEIDFGNREDFERIWPIVLKLKDKGAPIRLRSIEKPFKKGRLFNNERPVVRIYSHVWPAHGTSRPGGKVLIPVPPWPDSIKSSTGELPEYVTISEDGMAWVPVYGQWPEYITISVDGDPWMSDGDPWMPVEAKKPKGFMYRARTDIELVVDGKIVDLNRINLPADTPIIDNRNLSEIKPSVVNHTEWVSECLRRSQSIKPGATRADLLELFTTEGGVCTRTNRRYVYKECPYIKVDVQFKPIDDGKKFRPEDIITEISPPFLEWSILD